MNARNTDFKMCANCKYLDCQNAQLRPLRGLERGRFKMTFMSRKGTLRTACQTFTATFKTTTTKKSRTCVCSAGRAGTHVFSFILKSATKRYI